MGCLCRMFGEAGLEHCFRSFGFELQGRCSARFTCSYGAITCGIISMTMSWVEIWLKQSDEDCAGKGFVAWVFECGHGLSLTFQSGLSLL